MSTSPIRVCIQHPVEVDLERFEACGTNLGRAIEFTHVPFREPIAVRRTRVRGVLPEDLPADLRAAVPAPSPQLVDAWARAEVLVTLDLGAEHLARMPNLRWVQAYSAGIEQFPVDDMATRGIKLTTAAGAGAPAIAEFVLGRLIEVVRNTRAIEKMQRARAFHRPGGRTLAGRTLGIVGFGAIGRAVAKLARALDMRTLAVRRHPENLDGADLVDSLRGPDGLEELLASSDVVVLCAPATPETIDLIDGAALGSMRPGAILCNVARGALVDEGALCRGLESGHIGAAILDVTREEPLSEDAPLWGAPNLYLSPHSSIPPDAYDSRLLSLFEENLGRYVEGNSLENEVAT